MLYSLRIENFALIDQLEVALTLGLTVLTGETGAGKSIILDALDGVLGGKVTGQILRVGAERGRIEAAFHLSGSLRDWLIEMEIDPLEEEGLVCSREFSMSGSNFRSRSRINGVVVNRQQLDSLRDRLIAITAQGQAVQLAATSQQRQWLDSFGGDALLQERESVLIGYRTWQEVKRALEAQQQDEQHRLQQLDLLKFQWQELNQANVLDAQELEQLEQQYQRLNHVTQLQHQGRLAYAALYEGNQQSAAADVLAQAQVALGEMVAVDPQLLGVADLIDGAIAQVEEAARQIRTYTDTLEADPDQLDMVANRIAQLNRLCRKYGPTLKEVISHRDLIGVELNHYADSHQSQAELEARCHQTEQVFLQACDRLHTARVSAAHALETQLIEQLKPLGMANVQFQVQLSPIAPSSHGSDHVTFLFSPNPGQPPQPLGNIASGGEMSRFLLALQACFSAVTEPKTLIFDEIDAGVSGRVAQAIAEKLHHLSQYHQVLCVTHQSLVAAMADQHLRVEKVVSADESNTMVRIHTLSETERPSELAQLAGGGNEQPALNFATALLEQAASLRQPSTKKQRKTRIKS